MGGRGGGELTRVAHVDRRTERGQEDEKRDESDGTRRDRDSIQSAVLGYTASLELREIPTRRLVGKRPEISTDQLFVLGRITAVESLEKVLSEIPLLLLEPLRECGRRQELGEILGRLRLALARELPLTHRSLGVEQAGERL